MEPPSSGPLPRNRLNAPNLFNNLSRPNEPPTALLDRLAPSPLALGTPHAPKGGLIRTHPPARHRHGPPPFSLSPSRPFPLGLPTPPPSSALPRLPGLLPTSPASHAPPQQVRPRPGASSHRDHPFTSSKRPHRPAPTCLDSSRPPLPPPCFKTPEGAPPVLAEASPALGSPVPAARRLTGEEPTCSSPSLLI